MKRIKLPLFAALAVLVVATSGCVVALGNSGGGKGGSTTMGQQLTDLKKARDAGALSDSEYEAQRQKLLCNGKK